MADYVTAAEIKAAMPDVFSGSTHDALLATLATRASRLIDGLMGWGEDGFDAPATATDRYYAGSGLDYLYIDPCVEVPAVAVKVNETASSYTAWTADTDFIAAAGSQARPQFNAGYYTLLLVLPGVAKTFTESSRAKTVKVTGKWGRTASPPEIIKQAVIVQVGRWFKRGQSAFQDTAGMPDLGTLQYTKDLDPDIKRILLSSGYRRTQL